MLFSLGAYFKEIKFKFSLDDSTHQETELRTVESYDLAMREKRGTQRANQPDSQIQKTIFIADTVSGSSLN